MRKTTKSINYQNELAHVESDKKIPRLLPILFFILIFIIIISLLVFVRNYHKNSPTITPDTSPMQILYLIPQPTDASVVNTHKDTQNIEKINTPSPTKGPTEQSENLDNNVYNNVHTEQVYPNSLDITTLAPINYSYVAGRTITLAFNTTNPTSITDIKAHFRFENGSQELQDNFVSDSEQTSYAISHTKPVNIPDNVTEINLELTLIDQYQQVKMFSLTYYRR